MPRGPQRAGGLGARSLRKVVTTVGKWDWRALFHLPGAIAMVCWVLGKFKEKSGIALTTRSSELGQVEGCRTVKQVGVVDLYTGL